MDENQAYYVDLFLGGFLSWHDCWCKANTSLSGAARHVRRNRPANAKATVVEYRPTVQPA